jgi:CAAX prenyl protease-like protein
MWPRILPFGLYMAFLGLESLLYSASAWVPFLAELGTLLPLWLYPVKTLVVLGALVYGWCQYDELHNRLCASVGEGVLTLGAGVLVYLAWVRMDWSWATLGQATGYDPWQAGASAGVLLAVVRLFGAAVVVPIMEELFWRSFLLRFVITLFPEEKTSVTTEFTSIPLGMFTPVSFLVTVVLFGSEHALWLAGMMAGAIYTLLLYKTRRLWPCVLAHGVTNLLLGVHVLVTREWQWW